MLKEVYWRAGREDSRGLFLLALGQRVVALSKGETKGKVLRWLTTRLDYLCFRRGKVHESDARGSYALDKVIGLKPGQKATQWVQMRAIELATGNTYRSTA